MKIFWTNIVTLAATVFVLGITMTAPAPPKFLSVRRELPVTNAFTLLFAANSVQNSLIRSNANYRSIIVMNNPVNLFSYDLLGHTSYVSLASNSYNNQNYSTALGFVTNQVVIAGFSAVPNQQFYVSEYSLSDNGFVPTNAVWRTNHAIGDGSSATATMCVLKNNGVALITYPTSNNIGVYYRLPSTGTWTNMPLLSVAGIPGLSPAKLSCAEHPADNSFWLFINRDSCGCVYAAKFVTSSNGTPGLFINMTNTILSDFSTNGVPVYDGIAPYGEFESIHADSDWVNNRIVLYFNNNYWATYACCPAYYGDTHMGVASMDSTGGVAVVWSSTKTCPRLTTVVGSIPAANTVTLSYVFMDTNAYLAGVIPLDQQDLVSSVEQATNFVAYQPNLSIPPCVFPYSRDIIYSDTNNVWHLSIRP